MRGNKADILLGFFGFNIVIYGNIKKGGKKWFEELREQRAIDIETEML